MHDYVESALANQAAGTEMPFTTIRQEDGRVLGSTRYLALRPEHRSLEIGWTWLTPEAWGTGANVEAKLLMLGDAFERLGCLRVELKTDARNERSRGAMAALPAQFEGVHRKQMLVRDGRPARLGLVQRHRRRVARGAGEPPTPARAGSGNSRTSSIASGRSRKTPCPVSAKCS